MLSFSVGNKEEGAKDTVANIRQCPEFVVHIVSDAIKDKMNVCAVDYPLGIDEIGKAGFTALPSRKVRPPRIAEAPVAMECRLIQIIELGRRPNHLVIGEVVYFHYHDGIVDENSCRRRQDQSDRPAGRAGAVTRASPTASRCRASNTAAIKARMRRARGCGLAGRAGAGRLPSPWPRSRRGSTPTGPFASSSGFAPGGATDLMARALSHKLTGRMRQQVIVDNRRGRRRHDSRGYRRQVCA
jgi:flavin reductase (DIM6/NTAB) family NADH-FMN oxidoreductase RutF